MEWLIIAATAAVHAAVVFFEPIVLGFKAAIALAKYFGPNQLPEQLVFDEDECKNCNGHEVE
jgi:hypothetical protein